MYVVFQTIKRKPNGVKGSIQIQIQKIPDSDWDSVFWLPFSEPQFLQQWKGNESGPVTLQATHIFTHFLISTYFNNLIFKDRIMTGIHATWIYFNKIGSIDCDFLK